MQKFRPRCWSFTRSAVVFFVLLSALCRSAFAVNDFRNNATFGTAGGGTIITNWAFGGNWSAGTPPTSGQGDINVTNVFLQDTIITNASGTGLNYLRIVSGGPSTSAGSTSNLTVITSGDISTTFGLQLGRKATLVISSGNATFGSGVNNSFDLSGGGTLAVSNAATVFLRMNSDVSASGGTIVFAPGSGQTAGINYAPTAQNFINASGNTIVKNGAGTGTFVGEFGGSSQWFRNEGTIVVNSGTLVIDPRDAFSSDGFSNAASGFIQINSGATFAINRTANAWNNDSPPDNYGTIYLNGGTFTVLFDAAQASDRPIDNYGTIMGSGTLAMRVNQGSTGQTIASNGVLNVFQTVAGNQQTFTSIGGAFGTMKAVSGGTLKINGNVASGNAASWIVDSGGTLEVAGVTVDLGSAFIPASQLNGTVRIGSGGALTLSGSTGNSGQTLAQSGTILFTPGSTARSLINMAGVGSLRAFTNNGYFILANTAQTGSGEFIGGGGGSSYGFINAGTIVAGAGVSAGANSPTLSFNTLDATTIGFSNTASGTIIITNGANFRIDRTATGWAGDTAVNMGTMIFSNGTFVTALSGTANQTNLFRNAGIVNVLGDPSGNVTSLWRAVFQNQGTLFITNNGAAFLINTDATTTRMLTNLATGNIVLGANGAVGSLINTNSPQFNNLGTIVGQGTITLGRNAAAGGNNARLINDGIIIATNWGGSGQGTLFISTGNAMTSNGFLNTSAGSIYVGTNMTLVLNRSSGAWGGARHVTNAGSVYMQGGTFATASDGATDSGAARTNINTGLITGWGDYRWLVSNAPNAQILADARQQLNRNQGTLAVSLLSFTNNNGSTLGAIGTNSTLLLAIANGALLNFGTIQLSAGNIVLSNTLTGTTGGSITNFNTIAGVGDVSTFPIVQSGAAASLVAKDPTDGSNDLVATVGTINSSLLGAVSNANGIATLRLTTSTGNTLSNAGTIALEGGRLTVNGLLGVISNSGTIYGFGVMSNAVANLSAGTILASNAVLQLGAFNDRNLGTYSNFNSSASIRLTNSILVNSGKIFLSGGGLYLAGSTITNEGTITGPGDSPSALVNTSSGRVIATNGTLHIATNANEFVENSGTILIVNGGTLNVGPVAWNNLAGGLITNASGGVITRAAGTGMVTNAGHIANAGTFDLRVYSTGNITNTGGHFTHSLTNAGVIVSSGGTFSGGTFGNIGGTVIATNSKVTILNSAVFNTGTIVGSPTAPVIITNITANMVNAGTLIVNGAGAGDPSESFRILRISGGSGDFTNEAGGLIQGAGFFQTGDFVGGGRNFTIWNKGAILATNGTALILQPADAFGNGGFVNVGGGTVTVANAVTFGIQRSDNAWDNSGTVPRNEGVIQLNGGAVNFYGNSLALANDRALSNATSGTIIGFGTWNPALNNLGTVVATNGTFLLANTQPFTNRGTVTIQGGATFTMLQNSGSFQNNGTILMLGGTYVGTNFTQFHNNGTISGFGTLNTGRTSGSGGANVRIVNSGGHIIATNGTLFVNPGDAFSFAGFTNTASARITVAGGAAFVLNRTVNAWNNDSAATNVANLGTITLEGGSWSNYADGVADSSRFVKNVGTILGNGIFYGSLTNLGTIRATNGTLVVDGTGRFGQQGTLDVITGGILRLTNTTGLVGISFTNNGNIVMRGGELQAGVIANTTTIFGFGTIAGGGIDNSGAVYASNGVLTAGLSSFTNTTTAVIGTLTTNATLDVAIPGGAGQPLINRGTISMQGGTLLFNGSASGVISNRPTGTVVGVGLVTQTVINDGTILAANPVSGLSIFSVALSDLNSATIGASNGAVLNIMLSGGAGSSFNNNGSITMLGGTLIISNGAPGVITNNLWVRGSGTISPAIVNNSTIVASVNGGTLDITLLGGTNSSSGWLLSGLGAVLQVQNRLVNLGTIGPNGVNGGTVMIAQATGIITNRSTGYITSDSGPTSSLTFNSVVHNVDGGTMVATNGQLVFAAVNGLYNSNATIRIISSGTLQSNSSNSWSNAGTIQIFGGTLRTGGFTNAATSALWTNTGTVTGFGTIIGGGAYGAAAGTAGFDKTLINLGTIIVTNPLSGTAQTLFLTTGGATSSNGILNLGTMIISSNNTLNLNRTGSLPIVNNGTITVQNGTLTGSGVLSNAVGGIIEGYGTLTHQIVNQSAGTIRATNGLLTMTSSIFPINEGTMQVSVGATMTWNTSNSWRNLGTVDLRGGTLRTGGFTQAFETAIFTNANFIRGYGTIFGGGAFNTNGIGIDKSIVNQGTVIASGGVLVLDTGVATSQRGLANLGTMIVASSNDTLVLSRTAEISGSPTFVTNLNYLFNSGTIIIRGGTLTSLTAMTNQFEGAGLPGLIQGFGHLSVSNLLVNLGTIRSTNNAAGGDGVLDIVNLTGASVLRVVQSGTLVVENGSEMIFGINSNSPLANAGTIVLRGGHLRSGNFTNQLGATFSGFGTITSPTIINAGTGMATSLSRVLRLTSNSLMNTNTGVLGAINGRLVVDGVFTNAGTVSFVNSRGTFNAAVVNQGAWVTDPSTLTFNADFTIATNGYITMAQGDTYIFKSNFVNHSVLSNLYNTSEGTFVFDGDDGLAGTYTQLFYVAGLDLGGAHFTPGGGGPQTNYFSGLDEPLIGYSNNFSLGTLVIGSLTSTSTLSLIDLYGTLEPDDGWKAGLYVNTLTIHPGSLLIISNNVELYFKRTNGVTGISIGALNPGDNVLILDGGSFHQLAIVPEPSILMLLVIGSLGIYWRKRRKQ